MTNHYQKVLINLELTDANAVPFPFSDYGFLYGYGLFESLRVHDGQPILLRQHVKRMEYASKILDIPYSMSIEEIEAAVQTLIQENQAANAVLNFYLTPGNRSNGAGDVSFEAPFFMAILRPLPEFDSNQQIELALREESFKRTKMDRFKTMTYMKNILEKRFAAPFDDVLLYTHDNVLLESSTSNLFLAKGDLIFTPRSEITLPGITRQYLINYQEELGVIIKEADITLEDLPEMDEIFLTNSIKGVTLVGSVEGVSGLSSGPVALNVKKGYEDRIGLS